MMMRNENHETEIMTRVSCYKGIFFNPQSDFYCVLKIDSTKWFYIAQKNLFLAWVVFNIHFANTVFLQSYRTPKKRVKNAVR